MSIALVQINLSVPISLKKLKFYKTESTSNFEKLKSIVQHSEHMTSLLVGDSLGLAKAAKESVETISDSTQELLSQTCNALHHYAENDSEREKTLQRCSFDLTAEKVEVIKTKSHSVLLEKYRKSKSGFKNDDKMVCFIYAPLKAKCHCF